MLHSLLQALSSTLHSIPLCTGINWVTWLALIPSRVDPLCSEPLIEPGASDESDGLCHAPSSMQLWTFSQYQLSQTPGAPVLFFHACSCFVSGLSGQMCSIPSNSLAGTLQLHLGARTLLRVAQPFPGKVWDQPHTKPAAKGCHAGASGSLHLLPGTGIWLLAAVLCRCSKSWREQSSARDRALVLPSPDSAPINITTAM